MNRPKVADALSYLDQVKARFSSQNAIYTDFLDVMRQFKAQTIGTDVVIRRVRELFEGHPDLIVGFNTFIPQGYIMEGPGMPSRGAVVSLPSTVPTYSTEVVSPAMLPSFSAFRHSDTVLQDSTALSSPIMPHQTIPTTEQSTFYNSVTQPPVLRTHLTATDSQQPNIPHNYHTLSVPSSQPIVESHIAYPTVSSQTQPGPSQQQVPYVPNAQQQHNAQSFNHAIIYVNKVKNRFQAKPDVYKRFLEILQWYQREQDHSDPMHRKQAELQVYQDVAKLLHGHEDLLQEFSRFLPESTGVTSDLHDSIGIPGTPYCSVSELSSAVHNRFNTNSGILPPESGSAWHRGASDSPAPPDKKLKRSVQPSSSATQNYTQLDSIPPKKSRQSTRDVSLSDLGAGLNVPDTLLLQKIRNVLDADSSNGNRSYQSLLQNINLFNRKLINEKQLIETAKLSLQRHPELSRQFCDMFSGLQSQSFSTETRIRTPDRESIVVAMQEEDKRYSIGCSLATTATSDTVATATGGNSIHPLTGADMVALVSEVSQKRLDLDFNKLRTCGASYRALPSNFPLPKCSGRAKSAIAREVLNDTYISFSSLTSEDSQFVSSKKNQYEENMYHTEDERYEADMVMEVNRAAQQNLIVVKRRLDQMKRDELHNFRLDDYLGGTSSILMKKAVHRVYGDKATDVIYGLKTCPNTVVPIVIQRMRQKETEWKEAVRKFQQFWSDQDSKNHLRSLDHQGATFKQRDNALIRPKHAINHIESIACGDGSMSSEPASWDVVGAMINKCLVTCPSSAGTVSPSVLGSALSHVVEGLGDEGGMHLTLEYPPPETCAPLLEDVASLIIHHVKRQSNTSKEDKRTMKFLVRAVVQDLFMQERFPMSDDENDDDENDDDEEDSEDDNEDFDDNNDDEDGNDDNRNMNEEQTNESDGEILTAGGGEDIARPGRRRSRRHPRYHHNGSVSNVSAGDSQPVGGCESKRKTLHGADETAEQSRISVPGHPLNEEYCCLFYANNQWYAFLRLHHLLLTRLSQLRARAQQLQQESIRENGKTTQPIADILRLRKKGNLDPKEHYTSALQLVKDLLDGCEDVHTYEDRLRDMFGIYAYPWFTMDRLITNLVRQLHIVASGDDFCHRLTTLFRGYYRGAGGPARCRNSDSVSVDVEGASGPVMLHAPITRWNKQATFHTERVQSTFNALLGCEYFQYQRQVLLCGGWAPVWRANALTAMPNINDICGPLRTRYVRLKEEARYQYNAFAAGLESAASSSTTTANNTEEVALMPNGQSQLVAPSQLPPRSQVPNCYTLVMLRQASKLLIRLLDPSFVINTCVAAPHHQHLHIQQQVVSSSYPPQESKDLSPSRRPHDYRYQQPTPEEEKRAAMALKRAQSSMESGEDGAEVRHWYDYLARYLLIPGCWTAGPVPANLLARVRPVFLYKNLRRCVNKMMTQAIERRKQEIITTGDPQPEEIVLKTIAQQSGQLAESSGSFAKEPMDTSKNRVVSEGQDSKPSGAEPQAETLVASARLEKDVWELMIRVLRNNLTRTEVFRDTYSSDFMQSRKSTQASGSSSGSASKTAYKINWSVGSYGIFVRFKQNRSSHVVPRSSTKFREFQTRWLNKHATVEQVEAISAQLNRDPKPEDTTSLEPNELLENCEQPRLIEPMDDDDPGNRSSSPSVKKEPQECAAGSTEVPKQLTTITAAETPNPEVALLTEKHPAVSPKFNGPEVAASTSAVSVDDVHLSDNPSDV